MRRWLILPAASDRSKRSAGFLSIPGIAIWKGCPDLPRSRCLCDTQCGDGSSLCRLARSDLPASFPSQALPSGKDVRTCQGRAVFATRNAAMAHLPAASDRSKRSAGFLSIPGIAIWKGCPDLPRSRCLCDTQCGDGSSLCRLHLIARSDLPASFPGIAIWKGPRSRCLCDTQCGDGSSCRLHLIARSDLPASFPSQALPSGKDVRTCQGRAVFATRNAAMAHLSAGSLEAICRLPLSRHCHLERSQGRAVFATRNAAMAHLSAGCI